jgi:hypothetical protein
MADELGFARGFFQRGEEKRSCAHPRCPQ